MGLLSLGTPLSWSETKQHADHVRKHGILQFLHIYNKLKDRENDCLKWGDEVEYTLLKFDHENKKVYNNLKAKEMLDVLTLEELNNSGNNKTSWRPEYASYMVEGIPGQPLGGCMRHFNMIEANMKLRQLSKRAVSAKQDTSMTSWQLSPRYYIDKQLARHYAHLFIRDPVTLFCEHIYEDDEQNTNHFENIQSTNWQTMRFKPPPLSSSIGWRVEFRSCDVQLTNFENAAFVAFIVLLTRAILSFHLSLLVPLSKVDENMVTAGKRDAVSQGKFYFRKTLKKSTWMWTLTRIVLFPNIWNLSRGGRQVSC